MPVKIASNMPAAESLALENIFVMSDERAESQDIRPLKILILNLMPTKEITETQLLRLLSNTPLQIDVTFLRTASYESTNTSKSHLENFYKTFDQIKKCKFDGLIITGAPVEHLNFETVIYWNELTKILEWAKTNVFSSLYICWAAQAALYYHYGIGKFATKSKISGIFEHKIVYKAHPVLRGFDEVFLAPHSRNTEIKREDILNSSNLNLLAESEEAGVYLCASKDLRQIFVTGHSEYDADTLHKEYMRDINKGLKVAKPSHYYVHGVVGDLPPVRWRANSMLLISNWLNYCVYQDTPYNYTDTNN